MCVVESQAIGFNQRTGLLDVDPQCFAQDGVKNVGACMISGNAPSPFFVDLSQDFVVDRELSKFYPHFVHNHSADGGVRVLNMGRSSW